MTRTMILMLIGSLLFASLPAIAVFARVKVGPSKQDVRISP